MIPVSKPYLPPLEKYVIYLEKIWQNEWITNNGPMVRQFEKAITEYLQVGSVHFVSSGTMALQIAIKMSNICGEVITTAFSHVATVTSILWAGCQPVFVDINDNDFCINADKIEESITEKTSAIVATHVYGSPCNVLQIQKIAERHNLKVIYDGAHAFDTKVHGKSVFSYGDISAVSFHATKLYHTVEGGAIITKDEELMKRCRLASDFGIKNKSYPTQWGTNGKNSELHAAMGLCTLPLVQDMIKQRKHLYSCYFEHLDGLFLQYPKQLPSIEYNYSYFPVVFSSEEEMLFVKEALEKEDVFPRRYFYPALNHLPFYGDANCPMAESIAKRVLCLPMYYELSEEEVAFISNIIVCAMQALAV